MMNKPPCRSIPCTTKELIKNALERREEERLNRGDGHEIADGQPSEERKGLTQEQEAFEKKFAVCLLIGLLILLHLVLVYDYYYVEVNAFIRRNIFAIGPLMFIALAAMAGNDEDSGPIGPE